MNTYVKVFFGAQLFFILHGSTVFAQDRQLPEVQARLEEDLARVVGRNERYALGGALVTGFAGIVTTVGAAFYVASHSPAFSEEKSVALTLAPSFGIATIYFGIWGILHVQKKKLERRIRARAEWLRQDSAIEDELPGRISPLVRVIINRQDSAIGEEAVTEPI